MSDVNHHSFASEETPQSPTDDTHQDLQDEEEAEEEETTTFVCPEPQFIIEKEAFATFDDAFERAKMFAAIHFVGVVLKNVKWEGTTDNGEFFQAGNVLWYKGGSPSTRESSSIQRNSSSARENCPFCWRISMKKGKFYVTSKNNLHTHTPSEELYKAWKRRRNLY